MAIQINYSNSTGSHDGLNILRTEGLKAYFAHYESTFEAAQVDPINVVQDGQAFSTALPNAPTNPPLATSVLSAFSDLQYGGNTSLSTGEKSAFIAQAQSSGPGVVVGQLAYTLFAAPTHSLGGDLDVIQLGDAASLNASGGLHVMTEGVVDITNLNSVLNAGVEETATSGVWKIIDRKDGLDSSGVNTDTSSIWYGTEYGNNDTHNIIYDLMSRHGLEDGPKETAALQHVLNKFELQHNGTGNSEVFDGFDSKDTFVVNGGTDKINNFASNDVVDLDGYTLTGATDWASLVSLGYAYASTEAGYDWEITDGTNTVHIDLSGSFSLNNSNFIL